MARLPLDDRRLLQEAAERGRVSARPIDGAERLRQLMDLAAVGYLERKDLPAPAPRGQAQTYIFVLTEDGRIALNEH